MRLDKALVAEFLGTAFLLATVVGSGILADKLDSGNLAVSVLCIAVATAGVLSAIIFAFGAISAHFNPIVSLALAMRGEFAWRKLIPYWLVQIAGGICGAVIANLMFELPAVTISETIRTGGGQYLGEIIATFGLLGVIFGCARNNANSLPIAVPFYVAGAIYFTSSTCFANPAVTIARMFSNTLCGIAPSCVLPYIVFQIVGCIAAVLAFGWLFSSDTKVEDLTQELKAREKAAH